MVASPPENTVPTAAQVQALVRSHAEGDEERFYSVALQVAAQAARQWHGRFAQALRDVVDQARARAATRALGQRVRPVRMVQPRGELAGLLTVAHPKTRSGEMVLDPGVRRRLERVLTEQRKRAELQVRSERTVGPPVLRWRATCHLVRRLPSERAATWADLTDPARVY